MTLTTEERVRLHQALDVLIDLFERMASTEREVQQSSPDTYRLIQEGEIPTVMLGQAVRVRPADLEEFTRDDGLR